MTMFTALDRPLHKAGITYREVSGWKSRTAHRGGMHEARGVLWHHTATSASAVKSRNNPTLGYMVSGLGYPLCNYALAWDGSVDIVAAGTGAHAGKGAYRGIPRDQGNRYLIGIEVEGTTGLTWSDEQLETAAKLGAALDDEWGGLDHIGHYEYTNRKIDPSGIPGSMDALRQAIKRGSWSTSGSTTIKPAESKPESEPSKPSKSSGKEWPHVDVPVTDEHTTESHNAYIELFRGIDIRNAKLGMSIQKWLRGLGYYPSPYHLDGIVGPVTVKGLQQFLQSKGLYKGYNVDGNRGPATVRAEIQYLNSQRKYYT